MTPSNYPLASRSAALRFDVALLRRYVGSSFLQKSDVAPERSLRNAPGVHCESAWLRAALALPNAREAGRHSLPSGDAPRAPDYAGVRARHRGPEQRAERDPLCPGG